ncbi:MAG: type IV pilus secretin PilQ [Hydrogenophilales bacterium]|nr:type IV pilus secretin PilQ [Hydrogenophilales bacterium]
MLQSLKPNFTTLLGGLMLTFLLGLPAWAGNGLTAMDVSTGQNDSQIVKLTFTEGLGALPMHFSTANPHRIVLDFPGTDNLMGERAAGAINSGVVGTYRVVKANDRTRVVINLAGPGTYDLRKEGKLLFVAVQGAAKSAAGSAPLPASFAPQEAKQAHSIRNIDFRRGENGAGRVEVTLSDPSVGIDIKPKGQAIQVDFLNTSLPEALQRRLDVSEFATPTQIIETVAQGKITRMTIRPKGKWDYSAYQTGRQFIIEVASLEPGSGRQAEHAAYTGEKLSLDFQGQDVRAVLKVIADFTGLNIIAADSVSGNVTLRLKDVPWDQALDLVLRTKGMDKRVSGNVIWVAPRDELVAKERQELEAKKSAEDIEVLVTRTYRLNYVRADEAMIVISGGSRFGTSLDETASCSPSAEGIKSAASSGANTSNTQSTTTTQGGGESSRTTNYASNRVLTPRGAASYDLTTNSLIITDILQRHAAVEEVLRGIDVPTKQVLIEARVVLADDVFGRTLGARLGVQGQGFKGNTLYGTANTMENSAVAATSASVRDAEIFGGSPNVDLGTGMFGVGNAPSIGFTILNAATGVALGLELQALEADKRGKIISNPRVVTANLRPAVILQGRQIPYQTVSADGTNTQFGDALLCLLVSPQVLNNDEVILNVEVTKDAQGDNTSAGPAINVKRLKTQVRVKNGETAVLGGIFEQTLRNDTNKVPLLGDIPLLGHLFRNNNRVDDKSEMLVFLTPRLLGEGVPVGR